MREWKYMRGPEFLELDRDKTVVCVACSPMEVHGPHLPMMTDYCEAEGILKRTVELFHESAPEVEFVQLPPIYVAADVVPQPGSIKFESSTVIRVLSDLGRSLSKQGFKHVWVSNFHGGPRHFTAIDVACHRANRRHGARMVSVFGLLLSRLTGGKTDLSDVLGHLGGISREDLEGDTHGGAVETSMMLHLLGEHVDPGYRELEPMTVEIKEERAGRKVHKIEGRPSLAQLIGGFRAKLKYYEDETYAGSPAVASAQLGEDMIDTLSGLAAEALVEYWRGEIPLDQCHSPLWPMRWAFTNRLVSWCFEKAFRYRSQIW